MKKFMKYITKTVLFVVAAVMLFSTMACHKTPSSENPEDPDKPSIDDVVDEVLTPDGEYVTFQSSMGFIEGTVHERSIGTTSYNLLQGGATEYKIVVDEFAGGSTFLGASEFTSLFEEATGISLERATDSETTYSGNAKYISFGNTKLLQSAALTIDYATLGSQGYEILTKGQSIFIAGEDKGVLYGAYDLLEILFDFDQLTNKYYMINKNVTDLALPNLDIKEVPDITNRIAPHGNVDQASATVRNRMRFTKMNEIFITGASTHSVYDIVPISNYAEHPKWFYNDKTGRKENQLCYTAHGDSDEYEALVTYSVARCKELIDADPNHNVLSFSQNDINIWCNCDTCQASFEKYGTNAATQIFFINDVAERVEKWLNEERDGREVMFDILAYHQTVTAPTVKNEDGTYSAIDGIRLNDNVQVMIAIISGDYTTNITDPQSQYMRNIFESWAPVAQHFSIWGYDLYPWNYMISYDSWSSMQDLCKYLVQFNTETYYAQGSYNLRNSTNFDNLKSYLFSKLEWNVNIDLSEYIHRYFKGLYKDASDIMEQAFMQQRVEQFKHKLLGRDGSIHSQEAELQMYSKRYAVGQLETFDLAYAAVEKYKESDPEYYNIVMDEITLETIGPRYLILYRFSDTLSDSEYASLKNSFIDDVRRLDVNRVGEHDGQLMEDFIASLK